MFFLRQLGLAYHGLRIVRFVEQPISPGYGKAYMPEFRGPSRRTASRVALVPGAPHRGSGARWSVCGRVRCAAGHQEVDFVALDQGGLPRKAGDDSSVGLFDSLAWIDASSGASVLPLAGLSKRSFDWLPSTPIPDMRSSARWIALKSYLPQSRSGCGSWPSATHLRNVASSRPIAAAACPSLTSLGRSGEWRTGSVALSVLT